MRNLAATLVARRAVADCALMVGDGYEDLSASMVASHRHLPAAETQVRLRSLVGPSIEQQATKEPKS